MNKNREKTFFYGTFILFCLATVIHHRFLNAGYCDDIWFLELSKEYSLTEFLNMRYQTWSSRLIIETVLYFIIQHNQNVWRCCNILSIFLLVYSLQKLCLKETYKKYTWVIALFFYFVFPYKSMGNVGWVTTTVNYLWIAAAGTFALIPIKDALTETGRGQRNAVLKIGYVAAALFAANQEQMAALLAGYYLFFIVYITATRKKIPQFLLLLWACVLVELVFIFLCPGNRLRYDFELNNWFANYAELSMADKIAMGFLYTMAYYCFCDLNFVFIFFSGVLFCTVLIRGNTRKPQPGKAGNLRKIPYYIAAAIPFCASLLLTFFSRNSYFKSRFFVKKLLNTELYFSAGLSAADFALELSFYFLIIICVLIALRYASPCKKVFFLCCLIFCAGICSRIILGFSPGIFISHTRTACFCTLSLFTVMILFTQPYVE
ncbi:DUF6056 family protein [Treponema brennaborense]|uniref:Uncharacterized protein n=1 Tax=Treponema brennaborense (strain DSM 12168 / CIP 105900 / DD5/3) TaxID=906968 RepID=F4LNB8_TREBD|nr:DUF6056 family protein [Treponema brennaborense]AEE17876.1 hypothetical protein Trebr_2470 [Treponema brennaborense DSM 12168]